MDNDPVGQMLVLIVALLCPFLFFLYFYSLASIDDSYGCGCTECLEETRQHRSTTQ